MRSKRDEDKQKKREGVVNRPIGVVRQSRHRRCWSGLNPGLLQLFNSTIQHDPDHIALSHRLLCPADSPIMEQRDESTSSATQAPMLSLPPTTSSATLQDE